MIDVMGVFRLALKEIENQSEGDKLILAGKRAKAQETVSYTHLTLPTN